MVWRAIAILCLGAGAAHADCQSGEVELLFHHDAPAIGHPKGEAAGLLASFVNSELDGRACMTVVADAPGYSDSTVLEGLAEGRYNMAAPAMGNLGNISERFLIFDLPFMFRDLSVVFEYHDGKLGRELLRDAEEDGLLGLAYWTDGMKALSANRAVELPADFEGLTFGTQDALIEQFYFREMGAETETIELANLADALSEGIVDGQNTTWTNISARGLALDHEQIVESNHGLVQYMVVTDPIFWNGLDADLRADLELLIEIVAQERNRFAFELANIAKREALSDGIEIATLDEEEYRTWRLAMQSTWLHFGGVIGFDQISAVTFANQRAREIVD
ncbi:TRAP transporter substrate-binding protein DctP [Pontivivens insulae]|uniref:C4-dicarboxylate-binding periplasmic protein DctP n=1 Tax=Pontivivens insulae TaxID=1639689 RepID=A0A2R8A658_9RHOB|nr:TRAP transporter substrate-binding protein DctP [Pontivivens insulae]RED17831.1 C4-dicarboxylate-binding protein DctP [Pontivivens insulae]SPF27721.1 C4-dicarboxylate-binding periplasmic protein DctP [Pontivivens insulae]